MERETGKMITLAIGTTRNFGLLHRNNFPTSQRRCPNKCPKLGILLSSFKAGAPLCPIQHGAAGQPRQRLRPTPGDHHSTRSTPSARPNRNHLHPIRSMHPIRIPSPVLLQWHLLPLLLTPRLRPIKALCRFHQGQLPLLAAQLVEERVLAKAVGVLVRAGACHRGGEAHEGAWGKGRVPPMAARDPPPHSK